MRAERRTVAPELLLEEYRRLLQENSGIELPLVVSGNSMSPFLIGDRDTVYLARLERPVRRGDILLYRRDSGAYILHRVYRAGQGTLTMVGDAQQVLETGIRRDQILAVVTRAERKGKLLGPGSFWWEFFEKVWIRLVPVRRCFHSLYSGLCRKV